MIATVGPASRDVATLRSLIEANVDGFRLNFSHGTPQEHEQSLANIREACRGTGAVVAVMGDLCGPKMRVGAIAGGQCRLVEGATIAIQREPVEGTAERISTNYPPLIDGLRLGARVLLDDGLLGLRVVAKSADAVTCRVEVGGVLMSHKGVHLPDTELSAPTLIEKDRRDLAWAVERELDYIALSFVRRPDDVVRLRRLLADAGGRMRIVSKIETPQAIERLEGIIEESDVVLVARGDLGVTLDVARVPLLQKDITRRCQRAGKPVIVATQMLQSMVDSPAPTRAEVSDVANAILDGADAVMLSAETAVGRHPVEALRMLNRIAEQTEAYLDRADVPTPPAAPAPRLAPAAAVAHGVALLARSLKARVVAVWAVTGELAQQLSKQRLPQPVVAFCEDARAARRTVLFYGVHPVVIPRPHNPHALLRAVDRQLLDQGWAGAGELAIVVARPELDPAAATHTIQIHSLADLAGERG